MQNRARLVLAFVTALAATSGATASEGDSATIRQLSQKFSDASASGDAKTLANLLDDNVAFMGEDGSLYGKHDVVAGASPPPRGVTNHLVQSDFAVQLHGDVAVTSFTDNATFDAYGQVAHEHFRSTEVWLKEHGGWKMISSQTLAAPQDPPHVNLPAATLDQYVGSYAMAPGHVVRIERQGDGLVMTGKSGKPAPLLAEVRDVLFVPGQPRPRWVFERDGSGKVTGFDLRREGIDLQRFTRR